MNTTARFRDPCVTIPLGLTLFALLIAPPAARAEGYSCAFCDFDNDYDVDQVDFGHLQVCLSGSGHPQTDPGCADARLDGDTDVDQDDFAVLQACISGPGVPFDDDDLRNLLITEFMASNDTTLADQDGEYPDWIELHNPDAIGVDLEGWYLTDDAEDLTRWEFPAVDLDGGAYLVVFASGKDRAVTGSELHTNFKIDADGEYLALVYRDGRHIVHEYGPEYPQQHTDISYGLYDGWEHYFTDPTPGSANNDLFAYFVADTKFSIDRGFYETPFDVVITTGTQGATIRYTLDGSEPTETTGTVYAGPITINTTTCLRAAAYKSDWVPTNVDTQTYVFLDHVIQQPAEPDGFPTTWNEHPADYQMDPDVIGQSGEDLFGGIYAATIRDDLKSVPTLSLVMHVDDWFAPGGVGIYPQGSGSERAVSAEYIPGDGGEGFQIDCSVEIQGSSSTARWKTDKLSMRLKFKEPYGPTKLDFPLFHNDAFGNEAADQFDTIILDSVLNLSWLHPSSGQQVPAQYTRDQYTADLQNATGSHGPHGYFAHLYLNGLYWGMYYTHERPDESFAAAYLGGDKEDYDVLKHNSSTVVNGSNANYLLLLAASEQDLTGDDNYQAVLDLLEVDDFIDYMLVNFYVGNTDWAHQNWYASFNRVDPGGRWRYHSWDAEHVLKGVGDNVVGKDNLVGPTGVHQNLKQNAEYRLRFADHVHRHLFNDGVMTPENAAALYQFRCDQIDRAIVGESARWGDNRREMPYTRDLEWVAERDRLLNDYFPQRTGNVLNQLRTDGIYPDVDAPEFNQHGGHVPSGFELTMNNPNGSGTIYYMLDGADPRLYGGAFNPGAIEYAGPITLTENTLVKARVLDLQWSALSQAAFVVGRMVLINEFMADNETTIQDPDEPGDYPDWLELYNADTVLIDLSGMYLTDDLSDPTKWQIPPGITLGPGQYLLFWADDDEQQGDRHTNFKLDKEGEQIGLFYSDGATVIDSLVFGQQYDDVSYGRYPDGTDDWGFFATPTPGTPNVPHSGP